MDTLASVILSLVGGYALLGAGVAVWLIYAGMRRMDPIAAVGPWGFRLLLMPGLTALWPWALVRSMRHATHTTQEPRHDA